MGGNMKAHLAVLVFNFTVCGCSYANKPPSVRKDLKAFLDNAEDCQHFSGEWDSTLSAARQNEIEKKVETVCDQARRQKEKLKKRYYGNKMIEAQLDDYDF